MKKSPEVIGRLHSMMVVSGLIQFDQYAVATFRVNENHAAVVRTGGRCVAEKLITLGFQTRDIFIDIVTAETQVVNAAALVFEELDDRAFATQRMHQLDTGFRQREKCSFGFCGFDILSAFETQAEIFEKPFDGFFEIRYGNRDMVQCNDHTFSSIASYKRMGRLTITWRETRWFSRACGTEFPPAFR